LRGNVLDVAGTPPHTLLVKHGDVFARALALPERARLKLAAQLLASTPAPGVLSEGSPEFARAGASDQRV
jgi:hypothetical protein